MAGMALVPCITTGTAGRCAVCEQEQGYEGGGDDGQQRLHRRQQQAGLDLPAKQTSDEPASSKRPQNAPFTLIVSDMTCERGERQP